MIKKLPIILISILLLSGCNDHLVYVQETSLGVVVELSSEGSQKLHVGYGRDTFSIVPQKKESDDAVSLYSAGVAEIQGISEVSLCQIVATGEPAIDVAQDPDTITAVQSKIYGKDSQDGCLNSIKDN